MIGVLPPISEGWSTNGICMVTHISESSQNGMMIPAATDNNPFQENLQYQPSEKIPCEKLKCPPPPNHDDMKNFRKNGKNALVESLVDTTVQIIELIWYHFPVNPNSSQVIPLRLFIQETLRRSRTSWSTLQTALFYIMRIKSQIKFLCLNPDHWTLTSKGDNDQSSDPATCGRRMFLASLIVASKYLQDRNYANNAWSKICGLPVQEINAIERRFLKLIDYNLYIGEERYNHWSSFLRFYIQNSASETNVENQQVIAQFERTLQQPQAVECEVQG